MYGTNAENQRKGNMNEFRNWKNADRRALKLNNSQKKQFDSR